MYVPVSTTIWAIVYVVVVLQAPSSVMLFRAQVLIAYFGLFESELDMIVMGPGGATKNLMVECVMDVTISNLPSSKTSNVLKK